MILLFKCFVGFQMTGYKLQRDLNKSKVILRIFDEIYELLDLKPKSAGSFTYTESPTYLLNETNISPTP